MVVESKKRKRSENQNESSKLSEKSKKLVNSKKLQKTPKNVVNSPSERTPKMQMFKGIADLTSKNKTKKQDVTANKQETSGGEKQLNRAKRRRAVYKSKRADFRRVLGDLKTRLHQKDASAVSEVEESIRKLEMMPTKSKTALKKLRMFNRMLPKSKQKTYKEEQQLVDAAKKQQVPAKKQNGIGKKNTNVHDKKSKKFNSNVTKVESDGDETRVTETSFKDYEIDSSDESEAEEEHSNRETESTVSIKNKQKGMKKTNVQALQNQKGKPRYIVFVGSLSYTTNDEMLQEHFETVGEVVSVRIPLSKEGKHQGFAFVELKNEETYQRALSLHNSFLDGRRIVCEYTSKDKNKSKVKSKNLKLQQMRKQGMLKGSMKANQKRSVRRAKKKQFKASADA